MAEHTYSKKVRHPRAHVASYIINHVHLRKPWVIVWWAAVFPGCGHLNLCKYFTGFMLMAWELFTNVNAHINEAIMYSMIGQFDKAREVIDTRWFLLYIGVYLFAMWNCYKLSVQVNRYYLLADREDSPIMPVNISPLEFNALDVREPWSAAVWSFVTPGLGHLYINRLPTGFYMLVCFMAAVYMGHVLPAIQATMMGDFSAARKVIDPEWLLFLPSLYGFSCADSFINCHETNKLFKVEQSRFLSDNYQCEDFNFVRSGDDSMRFVSAFKHSKYLELAIIELEQIGIPKEHIFSAPLDKNNKSSPPNKASYQGAESMVDLMFIFATIGMLLGAIYGFIWRLEPVLWALFGIVIGGLFGLGIEFILHRSRMFKRKETNMEVVLLVDCEPRQTEEVERILWSHNALGVSKA